MRPLKRTAPAGTGFVSAAAEEGSATPDLRESGNVSSLFITRAVDSLCCAVTAGLGGIGSDKSASVRFGAGAARVGEPSADSVSAPRRFDSASVAGRCDRISGFLRRSWPPSAPGWLGPAADAESSSSPSRRRTAPGPSSLPRRRLRKFGSQPCCEAPVFSDRHSHFPISPGDAASPGVRPLSVLPVAIAMAMQRDFAAPMPNQSKSG